MIYVTFQYDEKYTHDYNECKLILSLLTADDGEYK